MKNLLDECDSTIETLKHGSHDQSSHGTGGGGSAPASGGGGSSSGGDSSSGSDKPPKKPNSDVPTTWHRDDMTRSEATKDISTKQMIRNLRDTPTADEYKAYVLRAHLESKSGMGEAGVERMFVSMEKKEGPDFFHRMARSVGDLSQDNSFGGQGKDRKFPPIKKIEEMAIAINSKAVPGKQVVEKAAEMKSATPPEKKVLMEHPKMKPLIKSKTLKHKKTAYKVVSKSLKKRDAAAAKPQAGKPFKFDNNFMDSIFSLFTGGKG